MLSTMAYRSASEINSAMVRVYRHMGLAVLTSMIVSLLVSGSPAAMAWLFSGVMKWVVMLAPLAALVLLSFRLDRLSNTQAQLALHGFAALMGLSFSSIFIVFSVGSIVSAFLGAAILFAVMSLWGYFTKRDLTGLGQFLFIGLIATVISGIVNAFIGNSLAASMISAASIIIFTGLTAYDSQKIREMVSTHNPGNLEIIGALSLYLNFINLFLSLLQLFGDRK